MRSYSKDCLMTDAIKTKIFISDAGANVLEGVKFDLVLSALGFEHRSADLVRRFSVSFNKAVAIGFDHANTLSYSSNLDVYRRAGFEVFEDVPDDGFDVLLNNVFSFLSEIKSGNVILIDISCFNRYRLAAIVSALFSKSKQLRQPIDVFFVYAVAEFTEPSDIPLANEIVGPAHPGFAGWSQSGSLNTAAILGLGYEPDQALGVVEHLQANPIWALLPYSPVCEYLGAVTNANSLLIEEMPAERIAKYDVLRPVETLNSVASIVQGLKPTHNVVMVPSGPKIFVLSCLLLAALDREISVWRVSQGRMISPKDKKSSEHITFLNVRVDSGFYE